MTEERKNELLNNLVFWATEVINDDAEIVATLHKSIGFTKKELEEYDVEELDESFAKMYPHISKHEDADYLFEMLTSSGLDEVESIIKNYQNGYLSLVIPRDQNGEIEFDGDWKVTVAGTTVEGTETDTTVLKWYEGYEDAGYMIDVLASSDELDNSFEQSM